jgi:hypothetical protein
MARKLDDIFNECYERIRSGESLESCLSKYPEYAAQLEPLLRTALDIGRRASYIQPRPEFKHWALVRLEGQQNYNHISQQRQPPKPGRFSLRQSWVVAVAAVLIVLLAGGGTVIASSNAMPDDTLYPVKLATEEARLTFAITDAQKAQVHIQLAETRAVEVETMANEGKTEQAAITAEKFAEELERASQAIAKMESAMGTAPPSTTTTEPTLTEPPTPTPATVTDEQPTPEEVPPAPPTTVTDEQPTPEEVPPAPPTVTDEQPTPEEVPPAPPTVTDEQPTPEEVPPAPPTVTDEQQPEEEPTPSKDTKWDKWAARRARLKKSVEESASKSLKALEGAKEKASPQNKEDWQRAIDKIWEKGQERDPDKNGNWEWQYWNKDENKFIPVWPAQPSTQNGNKTGNEGESNTVNPSQTQPYPSRWSNTGNK